jgi:anti-anti-sigma factor
MQQGGGVTRFTLADGTRSGCENRIAKQLRGLADEPGQRHLVLDFGNVEDINSSEICTLLSLHRKLETSGGSLTLDNVNPHLFGIFARIRLDRWLNIRPNEPSEAAVLVP